jgi:hypothetical protein
MDNQTNIRKSNWNIAKKAIIKTLISFATLLIVFALYYIFCVLNPNQNEIDKAIYKFPSINSDYVLDGLIAEKYVIWNKSRTFFAVLAHLLSFGSIAFSLFAIFVAS